MALTPRLAEAFVRQGYMLHLRFDDGTAADLDLGHLCHNGGAFEPLRDPEYFARLRVDRKNAAIIWPNGAAIALSILYLRARATAASL